MHRKVTTALDVLAVLLLAAAAFTACAAAGAPWAGFLGAALVVGLSSAVASRKGGDGP